MVTKREYEDKIIRIEELLKVVDNNTSPIDSSFIELNKLSNEVADYEERHFPVEVPTLIDVVRLRMFENNLNQNELAKFLGTTSSRLSEYLNGKRDLSLKLARALYGKLNIDPHLILTSK